MTWNANGRREKSVLTGADEIIDEFIGAPDVGKMPHYQHKKVMQLLCERRPQHAGAGSLLGRLVALISENCKAARVHYVKPPSEENWRFTQETEFGPENKGPEVTLERMLVRAMGSEFANQVPTASGLAGADVDKNRNIDLVRSNGYGRYEFIELKVGSNTPLMAAFEIYSNAAIYAYYRAKVEPSNEGSDQQPILSATEVALRTLAPLGYYDDFDLRWLEALLNEDIEIFRREQAPHAVFSDFAILAFPEAFAWPCATDNGPTLSYLRDMVKGIERLY